MSPLFHVSKVSTIIAVGFWFGIASIRSLLAVKFSTTDNTGTSDLCHLYWKMHHIWNIPPHPPYLLKTRQTHEKFKTFWHGSMVLWRVGGRSCQRRQWDLFWRNMLKIIVLLLSHGFVKHEVLPCSNRIRDRQASTSNNNH